ncbi:MAG: MOSC domain-containing protein [Solirubrobacterales bacterium]|nr:MOSC domain-containing protein [Solirubrobacterales bacterium]
MARGTVASLHRWPVKSLAGEPVGAFSFDGRGVAGDRAHALFHDHKAAARRLTIRLAPRMLLWRASYADEPRLGEAPAPRITAPDGRAFAWDDPALPRALHDDLGKEVTLRSDAALMQDLPCSLLVTTQATLDAVSRALGRELDLRRFRTNVHVVLDAPAFAEEGWEGRRLRIGDHVLDLLHPCERCVIPTRDPDTAEKHADVLRWLTREHRGLFGINARAPEPGRIAVGDAVELL